MKFHFFGKTIANEATGGVVLLLATALALFFENSFLHDAYHAFLHFEAHLGFGHNAGLSLDTHQIINDLLMAIFFLLVGLEIKHEFLKGHLSNLPAATMPGIAAVFGMAIPAAIFFIFNASDSQALRGWAIPSATDIAFALGVLALLGPRVPPALKVFLLAVAVLDDLGAILIIALFYTSELHMGMLGYALVCLVGLVICNFFGVYRRSVYMFFGVLLWYFVLLSGIHATIAGVLLAFTIPIRVDTQSKLASLGLVIQKDNVKDYYAKYSPAKRLEFSLQGWVTFVVLPLFAFTNAGVPFDTLDFGNLTGVTIGVALGLFFGKIIGIFGACWVMFKSGFATLPQGCRMANYFGLSMLCGIGFTMSLFITSLSYDVADLNNQARLGILGGSILAAICGFLVLRATLPKTLRNDSLQGVQAQS